MVIHNQTTWFVSSYSPTRVGKCFYFWGMDMNPLWFLHDFHAIVMRFVSIQLEPCLTSIFLTCCWSIKLHVTMAEMRTRNYKIWLKQNSCHQNQFNICLISNIQCKHVTFNPLQHKVMVDNVYYQTQHNYRPHWNPQKSSISHKANLQFLNIYTALWQQTISQS